WTISTITFREFTGTASELRLMLFVLLWIGGLAIIGCGSLFSIIVMGGATRNLVAHLLWNEPVAMRTTYRAVKERFWSLLGAAILIALWLALSVGVAFMGWIMVATLIAIGGTVLAPLSAWLSALVIGIGMIAGAILA